MGDKMARVNIEDRFFGESRLIHASRMLGHETHMLIGMLVYLWHDSQEMGHTHGTAKQIVDWCRLYEIQDGERFVDDVGTTDQALINALLEYRFITEISPGIYEIHGNQKQIDQQVKWEARAKKAADARWKPTELSKSNAQALPKHMLSDAIQYNSIQFKTDQNKEEEETPASGRFTETQLGILKKQFGEPFLTRHLKDAVACWDTYDPYRQSQTPLIKTVQTYLKNERAKPPDQQNRTLAEMVEAGEVEA
jgi:hypothetical protein